MKVFISKLGTEVEIDFDALPDASKSYVIAYGLRQSLNDCLAPKELTGEAAEARLADRIAALGDGTIGSRQSATPRDPVAAKALEIARGLLRKKFARKADPEAFDAKALELSQHDKIVTAAKKALEATAGLAIDLDVAA